MLAKTLTRRELFVWLIAAMALVVAITAVRTDRAGAGLSDGSSADVVFIATGLNFPDALGAGPAAAVGLSPILLVQQNAIPQATLDELNRLQPDDVFIIGGTSAISQAVEDAIEALAFSPDVTRIAGNNRYETAAELSQAIFPTTGKYPRIGVGASDESEDTSAGLPVDLQVQQIVVPGHGFLYVTAMVDTKVESFEQTATTFSCWLWFENETQVVTGSTMSGDVDSTNTEENCATQGVVAVEAGISTIGFRILSEAIVETGNSSLIIIWIPFSSTS